VRFAWLFAVLFAVGCGGLDGTYAMHHTRTDASTACGIYLADATLVIDGDDVMIGGWSADSTSIGSDRAQFSYSVTGTAPGDGTGTFKYDVAYDLRGDGHRLDGTAVVTLGLSGRAPCPWPVTAE
jgi:hypothetical protein